VDLPFFNLDIEPTNRCNAKCYFCPRDQTPHQGLMSPEVFDQTLHRVVEFSVVARERFDKHIKVNLCGLGEPLLNRHTPEFVRLIREAGFECSLTTNGALLDETRGRALLDAGLQGVEINVGEVGDDYEDIYKLPFERTRENVERFAEMAGDDCNVRVVLVDHRRDAEHLNAVADYWRERGITQFLPFEVMNRGGALFVDHMQYEAYPETETARARLEEQAGAPICVVPFVFLFVGYDGQYYLCCSDWKKEAPLGSVFDASFVDLTADKLDHVLGREPVCRTCNLDPINRVTEELRALDAGLVDQTTADALIAQVANGIDNAGRIIGVLDPTVDIAARAAARPGPRRLIPVQST
jgi:MoaA/NifB/PqqE/SkfB family radical SAM enzyme